MTRPRPGSAPPPTHTDTAHKEISAELVRLTIGGRGADRPELVDVTWRGLRAYQRFDQAMRGIGFVLQDFQAAFLGRLLAANDNERESKP
jgi:hypothetical protein